jgi:hypothetical protein
MTDDIPECGWGKFLDCYILIAIFQMPVITTASLHMELMGIAIGSSLSLRMIKSDINHV